MAYEKKGGWGGRRDGAGRKPVDEPRNVCATFSVSARTMGLIRQLRELTRDDEVDFNLMFVLWVDDLAGDYGIE